MNRRSFLKAIGLLPLLPHVVDATAGASVINAVTPTVTDMNFAATIDSLTAPAAAVQIADDVFRPNPIFQNLCGAYYGDQIMSTIIEDA